MPALPCLCEPLRAAPPGTALHRSRRGLNPLRPQGARPSGTGRPWPTLSSSPRRWLRQAFMAALLAPALGAHGADLVPPGAAPLGPAAVIHAAPVRAPEPEPETDWAARSRAMERARQAVVGVAVQAVEGARSARTLGAQRRGSGVLISEDGLVLTIGYLLIEADTVDLSLPDGREVPARVRAVDAATGLGLVQALTPTGLTPVPLAAWAGQAAAQRAGGAARLPDRLTAHATAHATAPAAGRPADHPTALTTPDPAPGPTAPARQDAAAPAPASGALAVTMVSGGPGGDINTTQVLGLAPFAGTWEYQIDRALLTHPPLPQHSGAALFNQHGELVGVGSLLLQDVSALLSSPAASGSASGRRVPGNLFVPADLLPPILGELQAQGRSQASARAWLGLQCTEDPQGLQVLRVNDDSPADVAGLQAGDRVLRLDGLAVHTLAGLWQRLWAGGAAERPVQLDILREGLPMTLTVHSVDRDKTWRRPVGI